MKPKHDIIVIGAGIIGLSTALKLQASGRAVTVVDRTGVAAEASQGNAGAFAFSDIEPLATPGVMRRAPKWLLDPLGPLSIPPAYALKITPWMVRFWRASWRDRYDHAVAAQAKLMALSQQALEQQIIDVKGAHLMRREGQLQLFEGERAFRNSLASWDLRAKHGVNFRLLKSAGEIADIQPGLVARFTHAGFTPDWLNTCDPKIWTQHIATHFVANGGTIKTANVTKLAQVDDDIMLHCDAESLRAHQVVVAAGAWSHRLAHSLGDKIPLETERGYNTTLPAGALDLRTHLTFGGHGFVVSKISDGVRVGGAVELGGLSLPPNFKRSEVLLKKAKTFLPELNDLGGTQWMGFRPSMPDSLPVIGPAPSAHGVFYAFGHGHLGLTQSAGTAALVASLVNGAPPPISPAAYSAARF